MPVTIIPGTPVSLSTNHIGPAIGQGEVEKQMTSVAVASEVKRYALNSGTCHVFPNC
jgi:hypothetical protein